MKLYLCFNFSLDTLPDERRVLHRKDKLAFHFYRMYDFFDILLSEFVFYFSEAYEIYHKDTLHSHPLNQLRPFSLAFYLISEYN